MPTPDRLILTPAEVRTLLRCAREHVYALLECGALRGTRRGNRWWVPRQAVEEYLARVGREAGR